jgi:HK97 family phage portal protein
MMMKKKAVLFLALILIWGTACLAFADEYATVTNGRLNLRQYASSSSPSLGQYKGGTWIRIIGQATNGWYPVITPDGKNGYIHDSDMLYLSWLSNAGGITPRSVLGGTLAYDAQIKSFSLKNLDGVHDVILLKVPGNLSSERRTKLVEEILSSYNASGKRALVLDSGMEASRLSGAAVDPKMLEAERVAKARVAGVYGMQPHLLGDGDNTTRSSEDEMQHFLTLSILPCAVQWEAECNKKLLSSRLWQEGYEFRFDFSALTRANTASLAEKYFKGVRGSYSEPNEVRAQEGLPPDDNGDHLLVSRDLLPLELIINHPELLLEGRRGKTNGEGENS